MVEDDDMLLFRQSIGGVKPLPENEKVALTQQQRLHAKRQRKRQHDSTDQKDQRQANAYFTFSDAFHGYIPPEGPTRYAVDREHHDQIKRLRRGDFAPEIILDLHGLSREEAKLEIAALLYHAKQQHVQCVCIVHGVGAGILKQQVPHWLIQHPDIAAFHQAPLEWGGKGALLVKLVHADPKLG
ncbi:endonuclease SmrB [Alteromonas flava]|uniref:endonuclease SmrB n=1 Tax=Alteromonas flava TaxID=2048003 RepID=UPI001F0C8BC1|nr:endonuclease SmrB [Alteromonas flava]